MRSISNLAKKCVYFMTSVASVLTVTCMMSNPSHAMNLPNAYVDNSDNVRLSCQNPNSTYSICLANTNKHTISVFFLGESVMGNDHEKVPVCTATHFKFNSQLAFQNAAKNVQTLATLNDSAIRASLRNYTSEDLAVMDNRVTSTATTDAVNFIRKVTGPTKVSASYLSREYSCPDLVNELNAHIRSH